MNIEDRGQFGNKLEWLFQNVRKPNGEMYTDAEVEIATKRMGIPVTLSYVYRLRSGKARNPSFDKIKAFSKFFKVSPAFFFEEDAPEPVALSNPLTQIMDQIALRAGDIENHNVRSALTDMMSLIMMVRDEKQGDD